ncbi:hypothetical protein FSP39_001188, partial [Pinctada imbricata]
IESNTELEKYWKAVRDNPLDFTGWTYLLQYVEQEKKVDSARQAYEEFFTHYPYCYGYWKKYADMERRHMGADRALEIFEKGVKSISQSVELWQHYINFYITEFGKAEDGGEEGIRNLYERAVGSCGMEFRSDKLWDAFIAWEKDPIRVTALYDRILSIPTQLYSHHFDNFKHHVFVHHPKEILPLDEFLRLRQEIVAKATTPGDEDDTGADEAPPGGTGPPGEEVPPGMEAEGTKFDENEAMRLREKIISLREEMFKKTEEEVSKRWNFEEGIKRPYFHVKPLERSQLKNWRDYLDFEIQNGSHERVVCLFERCMIATALYEDFWMKYAKYMEDHSLDAVRSVYMRACKIHLPKKPYIHLAWAAFEERQGHRETAMDILNNLEKAVPGLVMVSMRRISLERRSGNSGEAESLFQQYIQEATQPSVASFFSIKYARYLLKIVGDIERARAVLDSAIDQDKGNIRLYLQMLDLEYQCRPISEDRVVSPLLQAAGILKESYDEHQKLMKELHAERKKRPLDSGAQ